MFRPGAKRPRPLLPSRAPVNLNHPCALEPLESKAAEANAHHKQPPSLGKKLHQKCANQTTQNEIQKCYFGVLYSKRSSKKFKTYLDGFLVLRDDRYLSLLNDEGKEIAKSSSCKHMGGLKEGNTLEINSFEAEVTVQIPETDFESGRIFLSGPAGSDTAMLTKGNGPALSSSISVSSQAAKRKFHAPHLTGNSSKLSAINHNGIRGPLHDPAASGALVIQESFLHASGVQTIPVVLDPYINRRMRPHQRHGVKYLYECIEGKNKTSDHFRGAILADEMGLGKSLQSIALIWTVLKQGPLGSPVAKKAIIVCPASLVGNWIAEVKKWLGFERLTPIGVEPGSKSMGVQQSIADFVHGNVHRLLVVSYEMFRNYADDLYKSNCGLLVCDEGHRLKSAHGNKTIDALTQMPCKRRVILTGTPVQNDLDEFFSMCNFVNPGALGTLSTFRTVFAGPITASRDTTASLDVARLGESRANELHRISSQFLLRRTSETLEKYLPPKSETAIFCRLREKQRRMYKSECSEGVAQLSLSGNMGAAFCIINRLRKICCHPAMNAIPDSEVGAIVDIENAAESGVATSKVEVFDSAKLQIAISICAAAVASGDRVLVVSNFTATLDLVEVVLKRRSMSFLRLDGSTPVRLRTDLVKRFNSASCSSSVFLLSARAGGVGLNLIGANRLILFDPDWNPATDLQAMARVWRDGQKKDVFVYRLLSTGTIEEKIYQRQLFKGELQVAVGSNSLEHAQRTPQAAKSVNFEVNRSCNFSTDDLKDLFTFCGDQIKYCDTLEVLERSQHMTMVDTGKRQVDIQASSSLLSRFLRYRYSIENLTGCVDDSDFSRETYCGQDDVLDFALNHDKDAIGVVSYLYTKSTTDSSEKNRADINDGLDDNDDLAHSTVTLRGHPVLDFSDVAVVGDSRIIGSGRLVKRHRKDDIAIEGSRRYVHEEILAADVPSFESSQSDSEILRPLSNHKTIGKTLNLSDGSCHRRHSNARKPLLDDCESLVATGHGCISGSDICQEKKDLCNMESEKETPSEDQLTWSRVLNDLNSDL
jgi:DNA repair and recombination protein RAD54B